MKKNMYLVLKVDDINKYLDDKQIDMLKEITNTISTSRERDGKTKENYYHVCNVDEPYAGIVIKTILEGELYKEENFSPCGRGSIDLDNLKK